MQKVILYTKLNCPLCQDAYLMLMELTLDIPLEIDMVDITHAHNSNIHSQYAERIPVLAKPGSMVELNWPFTPDDVRDYLTA